MKEELATNQNLRNELTSLASSTNNAIIQTRISALFQFENSPKERPLVYIHPSVKSESWSDAENENSLAFVNSNIYPNPSTGLVYFDYPNLKESNMNIKVYDLLGKLIFEKTYANTNAESVDLSLLQNGSYLAKISIGSFSDTQRILIQK